MFTQRGVFKLVSDHLIQKGPAFKRSTDTTINAASGKVTVKYTDEKGKRRCRDRADEAAARSCQWSTSTAAERHRADDAENNIVHGGHDAQAAAREAGDHAPRRRAIFHRRLGYKAMHYVVKIEIGGIAGVVAPIVGKQPPDTHIWMLGGGAPVFIKSEGPMEDGGAIWRIELAGSPVFKK